MKSTDIKILNNKELVERYKEEKQHYQKMKFQNAVSQVDQPHKIKETRRNVARLLTELNARRIQFETAAIVNKMNKDN